MKDCCTKTRMTFGHLTCVPDALVPKGKASTSSFVSSKPHRLELLEITGENFSESQMQD